MDRAFTMPQFVTSVAGYGESARAKQVGPFGVVVCSRCWIGLDWIELGWVGLGWCETRGKDPRLCLFFGTSVEN